MKDEQPLFTVLPDGWRVYKKYKGRWVPNTYIIDQQGRVRFLHHKFSWKMAKILKQEIEALLNEKA